MRNGDENVKEMIAIFSIGLTGTAYPLMPKRSRRTTPLYNMHSVQFVKIGCLPPAYTGGWEILRNQCNKKCMGIPPTNPSLSQ